jgi:hypothetical protein
MRRVAQAGETPVCARLGYSYPTFCLIPEFSLMHSRRATALAPVAARFPNRS